MHSAPTPTRTEADVMSAALRLHGYPARLHGDGGTTFFAVPLDPETPADDVFVHPHFLISSGELADRPVAEHDEPWSAALYEGGREYVDVIYAGKPGLSIEKDAEACVLAVAEHAARSRAGHVHIPVPGNAERLVDAIQAAGANAWYDHEEGVVFAHPAGVPQERALHGEHISLQLLTDSTGWPGGFRAVAWVPDCGVDFHEVAQVFLFRGVPDEKEVDRGARSVVEWFSQPRPSAGAMLLRELADYGITPVVSDTSFAVPVSLDLEGDAVWSGAHLSIADRSGSTSHVPAAHLGWSVFRHDSAGEGIGDPIFCAPVALGRPECDADSSAAAAFIADWLTDPHRGGPK